MRAGSSRLGFDGQGGLPYAEKRLPAYHGPTTDWWLGAPGYIRVRKHRGCYALQIDGRPVGGDAEVAVFSFHPRKLVTTGEGGMIVTRNRSLARRLRSLRHHGVSMSDFARHAAGKVVIEAYREVGFNYRMTDLQAAVGLVQLGRLEEFIARRQEQGTRYDRAFAKHPVLMIPQVADNVRFNYQTYLLRLLPGARVTRDVLMQRLLE